MYEWGHKSRAQYLAEYQTIQRELTYHQPIEDRSQELDRLASFLGSVSTAWNEAGPELRKELARTLFDEVHVEDKRVVASPPRPKLEPFFQINLECQEKDIAGDPDGIRTRDLCLDRAVC
jgi:hypothetical protein